MNNNLNPDLYFRTLSDRYISFLKYKLEHRLEEAGDQDYVLKVEFLNLGLRSHQLWDLQYSWLFSKILNTFRENEKLWKNDPIERTWRSIPILQNAAKAHAAQFIFSALGNKQFIETHPEFHRSDQIEFLKDYPVNSHPDFRQANGLADRFLKELNLAGRLKDKLEIHILATAKGWEISEKTTSGKPQTLTSLNGHAFAHPMDLFWEECPRKIIKLLIRFLTLEMIVEFFTEKTGKDHQEIMEEFQGDTTGLEDLENEYQPGNEDLEIQTTGGSDHSYLTTIPRQKLTRFKEDGMTHLSLEQTVLLANLARKFGVSLKDENLSNTLAAYSWHLLTGYSKDHLRKGFSNPVETPANLEAVRVALRRMLRDLEG
ncbi:MAG: hypothetical protein H6581_01955 [Bacteroidia bacterium]|nr:hypothetical protein [Bacteroidia bacterium]